MVDERCGCGATFHYDVESAHYAERDATAWRAEHRHNDPAPAETTSADPGDVTTSAMTVGFVAQDIRSWELREDQ